MSGAASRMPAGGAAFLRIDEAAETERIARWMLAAVRDDFRRRGLVVALSGGVDSSVCAALAVKAMGPGRVFGLMMPERDSSAESRTRASAVARQLGIEHVLEDLTPALDALGCYRLRDAAIAEVIPGYGPDWRSKIAIAGVRGGGLSYFKLVARAPGGETHECRLPPRQYLQIVAATNFKQRVRKTLEYYHADRLHYAVVGTPNRLEYDQGFFVKNGDGAADLKPIAHLYKTQVYALARHLGLPAEICEAAPTTDTYSLPQGQDEFYFALTYDRMDVALWAFNERRPASELAVLLGIGEAEATGIYRDIVAKRSATRYLQEAPRLVEPVPLPLA